MVVAVDFKAWHVQRYVHGMYSTLGWTQLGAWYVTNMWGRREVLGGRWRCRAPASRLGGLNRVVAVCVSG